jgi:hypothetical protein
LVFFILLLRLFWARSFFYLVFEPFLLFFHCLFFVFVINCCYSRVSCVLLLSCVEKRGERVFFKCLRV